MESDDGTVLPFTAIAQRRHAGSDTILLDGVKEDHTYRAATHSKLLRSVRQTHSLHRAKTHVVQAEMQTQKKLTAMEQSLQSNAVYI